MERSYKLEENARRMNDKKNDVKVQDWCLKKARERERERRKNIYIKTKQKENNRDNGEQVIN
jgi:hypothetical protein